MVTVFLSIDRPQASGDVSWSPTDGVNYSAGSLVGGGSGKIVYKGGSPSHVDNMTLTDNGIYVYKAFAYNTANHYSSGIQKDICKLSEGNSEFI